LEGITKALVFCPEVLLCDIGLPDIDGYEVARRFKSNEKLKDIFLIALTGYAQSEDLNLAKKSGFNQHLAKPITLADLEQAFSIIPQFRARQYSLPASRLK
jgi:CheY-like chemotaxis protein